MEAFPDLKPIESFPALLIEEDRERILVISDIHIGWEISLSHKGIHIPSQTPKIVRRLRDVIAVCNPNKLAILGDVKYSFAKTELEEWRDVPAFFEEVLELFEEVTVIPGNHDGDLEPLTPRSVRIDPPQGTLLWGKVGLLHGHAWPDPRLFLGNAILMGHLHPVVSFTDALGFRITKQVWVRAKCDIAKAASPMIKRLTGKEASDPLQFLRENYGVVRTSIDCFILPSFNDFLGGQPVNLPLPQTGKRAQEYIGPMLRSGAVDMENAEVMLLDGTYLGTVSELRKVGAANE